MTSNGRKTLAAAVLLVGFLGYLARPVAPAIVDVVPGLAPLVHTMRAAVFAHVSLPSVVRGALSDAAWAFALGTLLADASRRFVALGAFVAIAHELAQGVGIAAGTFDPLDLLVLAFAYAAAITLFLPSPAREVPAS